MQDYKGESKKEQSWKGALRQDLVKAGQPVSLKIIIPVKSLKWLLIP